MAAARAPITRAPRNGSARRPTAASPTASSTSASSMPAASASNRTSPNPSNGSAWRRRRATPIPPTSATTSPSGSTRNRWRRPSSRSRRSRPNRSPTTPSMWRARPADGTRRRRRPPPRQSPRPSRLRPSAPPPRIEAAWRLSRHIVLRKTRVDRRGITPREDHLSADDGQDQDGPFRSSPTGPWVTPPRKPAAAPSPRPRPAIRSRRNLLSVLIFVVLISSIGVRAFRDLSRPEAWAYWRDQYFSPSLTSSLVRSVDLGGGSPGRPALFIRGKIGPAAASWVPDKVDEADLAPGDSG